MDWVAGSVIAIVVWLLCLLGAWITQDQIGDPDERKKTKRHIYGQ